MRKLKVAMHHHQKVQVLLFVVVIPATLFWLFFINVQVPLETPTPPKLQRHVWMLWDKGWDTAPPMQTMCLESFKLHNPDWYIHAISLADAERLIEREKHYNIDKWNAATIQAKSDIIRTEILAQYGGVWADATVYCMEPLSNWIDAAVGDVNFFLYERMDKMMFFEEKNRDRQPAWFEPWIAPWFIAACRESTMIRMWRDTVRLGWNQEITPDKKTDYYWVDRLFYDLAVNNATFRPYYKHMTFMDAGGPDCWPNTLPWEMRNVTPHVYTIKAPGCADIKTKLLEDFDKKQSS